MKLRTALRRSVPLTIVAATCVFTATVAAADANYALEAGVGRSDNIRRTSADEQSEVIGTAGFEFSLYKNTRKLLANIAGDLAYFEYFDDTYDAEFAGNLLGAVNLRIVPEHFAWTFEDNFGQVRRDPFAAVTPDNRENINYFNTGPDFSFRFGDPARMRLSGRYSNVAYERSARDNDRYSGLASLIHDFSAGSEISANAQTSRVEQDDNTAGADYREQQAYMRYAIAGARTRISVDLGYAWIEQEGLDEAGEGLLRLDVARRVSASSTLMLKLGREFSDAGNSFLQQQQLGSVDLDTQSGAQTSNPFISEYAVLGWEWSRQRTGLGLTVSYFDEDYELQDFFDVTRTRGDMYLSRSFTAAVRLQLGVAYDSSDFKSAAADYHEISGSATLSWRLASKLWLNFQYERFDRSADPAGGDYQEGRGWLRLRYGSESALPPPIFSAEPSNDAPL